MKNQFTLVPVLFLSIVLLACSAFDNSPEWQAYKQVNESPKKQEVRQGLILDTKESKKFTNKVLVIDGKIENKSNHVAKDFVIVCNLFGDSETIIQTKKITLFLLVLPKESKNFENENLGFVNSQTKSWNCRILDFSMEDAQGE